MPDSLTNFPNGISTSVVVLTGEDTVSGLESTVDVTGVPEAEFLYGTYINTEVIGFETENNFTFVSGVGINLDATNLISPGAYGPAAHFVEIKPGTGLNNKFYQLMGLRIHGFTLGAQDRNTDNIGLHVGIINNTTDGPTIQNKAISISLPAGIKTGSGVMTNYGLHIVNNGHASATNWAIFSSSTAPSFLGGPLIQKPAVSTIPVNNGEMTVSATSNTSITVRLKGTDGTVRSTVLTLT